MKLSILILAIVTTIPFAASQSAFPALLAKGPDAKYRDKLQLFGQFVGSWKFEGTEYHDDDSRVTDKGEIHFQWVLQGRAIQDVFLETSRSDKGSLLYGTTIRFYDPKADVWRITWIYPEAGVVRTLVGGKSGSEIILEGKMGDGTSIRWIFSDIRPKSFHWRGEKRAQSNWRVYEDLDARRE